jgi:hypothetical protein
MFCLYGRGVNQAVAKPAFSGYLLMLLSHLEIWDNVLLQNFGEVYRITLLRIQAIEPDGQIHQN